MELNRLLNNIHIISTADETRWVTVEDATKCANPFLADKEHGPLVIHTSGRTQIQDDTLILLSPDIVEYIDGSIADCKDLVNEFSVWNRIKYFLDFRDTAPCSLQECASGKFLAPDNDGVQEVINALRDTVKFLLLCRGGGQVMLRPAMPE